MKKKMQVQTNAKTISPPKGKKQLPAMAEGRAAKATKKSKKK